jgi:hypothetical protein
MVIDDWAEVALAMLESGRVADWWLELAGVWLSGLAMTLTAFWRRKVESGKLKVDYAAS